MDEALIKKIPPHSVEAERAVIGSMMMDKDAILVSSEILSAEDFYQGQYGELFTALVELYRSGVATDLVTLQNKLREMEYGTGVIKYRVSCEPDIKRTDFANY